MNDKTIEFREALLEGIRIVTKKNKNSPKDPVVALGWALYAQGIGKHPECLVRLAEWIGGKPKDTLSLETPIPVSGDVAFRYFLADGRSLAPSSLSLPDEGDIKPRR